MRASRELVWIVALTSALVASEAFGADPSSSPVTSGLKSGVQFEAALGVGSYTGRSGNATSIIDPNRAVWGLALIAGTPVGDSFSVQGDLILDGDFIDTSAYTGYVSGFVAAGHASWRDPSRGLFGFFGGAGSQRNADDPGPTLWFFGGEGQLYFNRTTVYLQAGVLDARDNETSDAFHNAIFFRGVARHFVTDMTAISGEVALASGRQDSGAIYQMGVTTWGLKVEHQLAAFPATLSAGYEGMHASNGTGGDNGTFTDHRFVVAAKFFFDGTNLFDNDRLGQTLDLPKVGRMVGAGNLVD